MLHHRYTHTRRRMTVQVGPRGVAGSQRIGHSDFAVHRLGLNTLFILTRAFFLKAREHESKRARVEAEDAAPVKRGSGAPIEEVGEVDGS